MIEQLDLENFNNPDMRFKKVEDLDDGSIIYEIDDEVEQEKERPSDFHENLAEIVDEVFLNRIASELLDEIQQDKDSRSVWDQNIEKGLKYAGMKMEDLKEGPFMSSCRAFDTTLSSAILRAYSVIKAELFPQNGPCSVQVIGEASEDDDDRAERIKDWMNFSLTEKDKEYDSDTCRLLYYVVSIGTTFRKVFQDPITKTPIARFIDPQDFIVNNNCVTLLSSNRLTHVLHLSRKEILLRQANGFYRDIEIPLDDDDLDEQIGIEKTIRNNEGVNVDQQEKKSSLMTVYEVHCDLDLEDFDQNYDEENTGIPKPYIVTICLSSRKVLSIYRNWKEDDQEFKKINYFIQYNYLPGYGLYGTGLFQLLGSNAICLTSLQRMLIDKGTLNNFPGGLRVKGLRIENNDKSIGPGEFLEVETGGLPIRDAIMAMPYSEPSAVLNQLRESLIQRTESLGSITEMQISEGNPNVPVGTTMMRLEVANRIQGIALSSIRNSLTQELDLLYNLYGETLPDTPYPFRVPGKRHVLMKEDFSDKFRITPISDPVLTTAMQRNLQNQFVLQLAQSAPELYNMDKIHKKILEDIHFPAIDSVLKSPEEAVPLDVGSENINMILGKPVKTAPWQDQYSHIIGHTDLLQQHPEKAPIINAHINEHFAEICLNEIQMAIGQPMPPLQQIMNPEIQNMISFKVAQFVQQKQMQEQQAQQEQTINPQQVMMMDIQQRQEAAALKHEESKLKAETEAFKAQLNFESEKNKQENEREISEEKNSTELELQYLKMQEKGENYV